MFDSRVLSKIFGKDKVTGVWRALHNEKLLGLCSSLDVIQVIASRRMRLVRHVVLAVERRGAYRSFVGKPEGKRPLGRSKHRYEYNIKMGFQEVGRDGLN